MEENKADNKKNILLEMGRQNVKDGSYFFGDENRWQEHLEKNYKSTGTKTNFENTRFKEEKNKYLDPTKRLSYGVVRKKKKE